MILYRSLLVIAVICCTQKTTSQGWQLGPFVKQDDKNPVLLPIESSTFFCPILGQNVNWECKDVLNPAAVVKDGKIHLFYRAEDDVGVHQGTSRIGLGVSTTGLEFERQPKPVLYPDNDDVKKWEWEGGCEDPRIVEDGSGTYIMTYIAYDGKTARILVASSKDLVSWKKHGPAFNGRFVNMWSKSGSIVTRLEGEKFIATKINDKYWMYWGDKSVYGANSDDLINWTPVTGMWGGETSFKLTPVFSPRRGKFDSDLVAPGPQALIRDQGIVLIYNARNKGDGGDPNMHDGTWCSGQVLLNAKSPMELLDRTEDCFFMADREYETMGQESYMIFLQGLVVYNNNWFLYYGTANSRIAVAKIQ